MVNFTQTHTWRIQGNLNSVLQYRLSKCFPFIPKYGKIDVLNLSKNDDEINSWTRTINTPLKFNSILLALINCYSINVKQKFYMTDGKLISTFISPKYISNFFSFEEYNIYEQIDDYIQITRVCKGDNKIENWLIFPLSLTAKSIMDDVEKTYEIQQFDLISQEILDSNIKNNIVHDESNESEK